jgi:hypothetical protein
MKPTEAFSQNRRAPDQNLKPRPVEYPAGVLPLNGYVWCKNVYRLKNKKNKQEIYV